MLSDNARPRGHHLTVLGTTYEIPPDSSSSPVARSANFGAALLAGCGQAEVPSPGSTGEGDPLYPGPGNSGYDVLHYTLVLDVDVDESFIVGQARIEANATQALSAFNLDFRGLDVIEVRVSGRPPFTGAMDTK